MSSACELSPVELNTLIEDQSNFSITRRFRQAFTIVGTTPNMFTAAAWTNSPNFTDIGESLYKAIVPRFNSVAKINQGPIIQPRLVGQHTTSPGFKSWWQKPSTAHLIGVVWVQGIAFGSPVVPEENKMLTI